MNWNSYQTQNRGRVLEPDSANFAVVGTVTDGGATLIFDGSEQESKKIYPCNKSVTFQSGQRVKIIKVSGTYLVEYPV